MCSILYIYIFFFFSCQVNLSEESFNILQDRSMCTLTGTKCKPFPVSRCIVYRHLSECLELLPSSESINPHCPRTWWSVQGPVYKAF